jgi:uncharacterized protein (TIGR02996 family)
MNEADTSEENAFLESIRSNPRDRLPRLVYADWLDERGDERAEFLRLQCSLVSSVERLVELHPSVPKQWAEETDIFARVFTVFRLPPLGDGVNSAAVLTFLARPFQRLSAGSSLVDVETDKATCVLPVEFDCALLAILALNGQHVPVGGPLALLLRV